MQQDALRRAREMYSRRPRLTENQQQGRQNQANTMASAEQKSRGEHKENHRQSENERQNPKSGGGDILTYLLKDKDKTIILALLILLSSEKTDSSLIFALMYLLM